MAFVIVTLLFQVKTCNDAHVLLSEGQYEMSRAYELVWGSNSNSRSDIRRSKQGPALQSA